MRRRGKILYLKLDTEMIRVQLNGDIYNDAYKCMFVNGIHAQMPNDTASDRFGCTCQHMRIFCAAETITCAAFPVMPDKTPNSTYLLCISEAVIVVLVGVVVHGGRARLQERKAGGLQAGRRPEE